MGRDGRGAAVTAGALTIRDGTEADAVACAAILNAWIDATPWMPRVHTPEAVERHYGEFVLKERKTLIAEAERVVGFAALDMEERYVTALYVAEDARGRGLGAVLMNEAKALSPSELNLWTHVANAEAQRFYLREGFAEVERTDGDNEENIPDIRYRWAA